MSPTPNPADPNPADPNGRPGPRLERPGWAPSDWTGPDAADQLLTLISDDDDLPDPDLLDALVSYLHPTTTPDDETTTEDETTPDQTTPDGWDDEEWNEDGSGLAAPVVLRFDRSSHALAAATTTSQTLRQPGATITITRTEGQTTVVEATYDPPATTTPTQWIARLTHDPYPPTQPDPHEPTDPHAADDADSSSSRDNADRAGIRDDEDSADDGSATTTAAGEDGGDGAQAGATGFRAVLLLLPTSSSPTAQLRGALTLPAGVTLPARFTTTTPYPIDRLWTPPDQDPPTAADLAALPDSLTWTPQAWRDAWTLIADQLDPDDPVARTINHTLRP